jgi:predicted dehydrogenase
VAGDLRIGLIGVGRGGPSSYHARSFSSILNGFDPARTPEDWPVHSIPVEGARVTTVWDENPVAARELAEVFSIDRVAPAMEDVSTDVDGVIVVDDITMTHQQRARFFLREGVPTFIDKPLASTYEEAAELVEIAESAGALVMSSSALRYARETREARGQIEAAGRLSLATAICQGQYMGDDAVIHYGIHPLELAYSVLGPGVATVQNVGEDGGHVVKLLYGDGRILLLLVFPEISQAFRLNLYGENGAVSVVVEDWDYFYAGMLEAFVGMIRDRSLPIPLAETLEIIRVLTAAKTSLAQGGATIRL